MPTSRVIPAGDRHISYLPLAHIYERNTVNMAIHCGCSIGFYRGDVLELLDDIAELRPTIFTSVPRLYNRIYDKVGGGHALQTDRQSEHCQRHARHGHGTEVKSWTDGRTDRQQTDGQTVRSTGNQRTDIS
jgi:AMP-binding enzyme